MESERPLRCAFVASEARCPPSLRGLLARENAAREREDLNALYVALTRARRWIVVSHTEPHRRADGPVLARPARSACGAVARGRGGGGRGGAARARRPRRRSCCASCRRGAGRGRRQRRRARRSAARAPTPRAQGGDSIPAAAAHRRSSAGGAGAGGRALAAPGSWTSGAGASDDPAARLGSAVHRVLEWATQAGSALPDDAALATLADAAAAEFGTDAAATLRRAAAVLRGPACARFFGGAALRWAGNEVAVSDGGEPLRIDRLVCLDAPGEPGGRVWWVLDYKLHHAPHSLAAYREQLLRYRAAVARLQPGETVRCAFVTGGGEVVEIERDVATAD